MVAEACVGAGDDAGFADEGAGGGGDQGRGGEELAVEEAGIGVLEDHGGSFEGGEGSNCLRGRMDGEVCGSMGDGTCREDEHQVLIIKMLSVSEGGVRRRQLNRSVVNGGFMYVHSYESLARCIFTDTRSAPCASSSARSSARRSRPLSVPTDGFLVLLVLPIPFVFGCR